MIVFAKIFDHCDPLPEKQLAGSIANENNSNGISDAFHRAMVETIPQLYKVIQKTILCFSCVGKGAQLGIVSNSVLVIFYSSFRVVYWILYGSMPGPNRI